MSEIVSSFSNFEDNKKTSLKPLPNSIWDQYIYIYMGLKNIFETTAV